MPEKKINPVITLLSKRMLYFFGHFLWSEYLIFNPMFKLFIVIKYMVMIIYHVNVHKFHEEDIALFNKKEAEGTRLK